MSLDSLNRQKFAEITGRDVFDEVYGTLEKLEKSAINLKLNVVVQSGINTDEINGFVELTRHKNIEVRFIEEMPFNGVGKKEEKQAWHYAEILQNIERKYQNTEKLVDEKSSTSRNFKIDNYVGTFGIIPAFTRTICGDCNRFVLLQQEVLKTVCLMIVFLIFVIL